MESYKVWLGDGSMLDGSTFETLGEAQDAIASRYGWDDMETVDGCTYGEWYCYESKEEADEDKDGAYAPSIKMIEEV